MNIAEHVDKAIDDYEAGSVDSSLIHTLIAIDSTSKKLFPEIHSVGKRYCTFLRRYYWIIEPMLVQGFNLEKTKFSNVILEPNTKYENSNPDFADIIYTIFRCSHLHGDEIPKEFSFIYTSGGFNSEWILRKDEIHMPDRVLWALLAVVVLCKANAGLSSNSSNWFSLGDKTFMVKEWWGHEDDFKPYAMENNRNRIEFKNLEKLRDQDSNLEPNG